MSCGPRARTPIVVIEPFSSRMRHEVDPDTPSAQMTADLIGETWLTIAKR